MHPVVKCIGDAGIVPVLTLEDAAAAVPVCRALWDGGLPIAEITFRTTAAAGAIAAVVSEMPELLVGGGTVLTAGQAEAAIAAGARFVVTPGFARPVVEFCVERQVPVIPGCSTPTDLAMAVDYGLDVVKFFPAEAAGGLKTLKAIAAPYRTLQFIPTGGIDSSNLVSYLTFRQVLACGGTWMVRPELIRSGDYGTIADLTRQAVSIMLGFELAHVGLNAGDAGEAGSVAEALAAAFACSWSEDTGACWVGEMFEVMKGVGRGRAGHIAVRTHSIPRALAFLSRHRVAVDTASAYPQGSDPYTPGSARSVFLSGEFCGLAVHLVQADWRP